jgi:predicted nucleic acid-binding protein
MARRTDAYLDTSALIAFADGSDTYHPLFRRLFSEPPRAPFTSTLVVSEGHGWFLRRYDRTRALQFIAMIEDMTFLEIAGTGPAELEGGSAMLRRFADQDLTLVDAVGLHLMEVRAPDTCWSTDHHLGLTGVRLAIYEH